MSKEEFCLLLSRFLQVANLEGLTGLSGVPAMYRPIVQQMLGGQDPAELLRAGLMGQAEQLTPEHLEWMAHGTQPTRAD